MSVRIEAVGELQALTANGGIQSSPLAGREARVQVKDLNGRLYKARRDFLMHELPNAYRINVFGSARPTPDEPEYTFVRDTTRGIVAEAKADIITGGGPGIMAAALEGAALGEQDLIARGERSSVRRFGVGIVLPFEQRLNEHVTHPSLHEEFLPRLQEFVDLSHGSYVAPGGLGTDLELAVLLQLQQVGHLEPDYTIVAHPFWEDSLALKKKTMHDDRVKENKRPYMNEGDLDKVIFSDDPEQIIDIFTSKKASWQETIGRRPISVDEIDGAAVLPPRVIAFGT